MSTYYYTCPRCMANLDPDERCDCLAELLAAGAAELAQEVRNV